MHAFILQGSNLIPSASYIFNLIFNLYINLNVTSQIPPNLWQKVARSEDHHVLYSSKSLRHVIPPGVLVFGVHFFVLSQDTATVVSSYVVEEIIRFAKGDRWSTELHEIVSPATVNLKMHAKHVPRHKAT